EIADRLSDIRDGVCGTADRAIPESGVNAPECLVARLYHPFDVGGDHLRRRNSPYFPGLYSSLVVLPDQEQCQPGEGGQHEEREHYCCEGRSVDRHGTRVRNCAVQDDSFPLNRKLEAYTTPLCPCFTAVGNNLAC